MAMLLPGHHAGLGPQERVGAGSSSWLRSYGCGVGTMGANAEPSTHMLVAHEGAVLTVADSCVITALVDGSCFFITVVGRARWWDQLGVKRVVRYRRRRSRRRRNPAPPRLARLAGGGAAVQSGER